MAFRHEIQAFSSFPYASAPTDEYEERAKHFCFCFKNGRGCPEKHPTFDDVVRFIVGGLANCPAFGEPSVLVPIPRSGNSRESFDRDACAWPALALATALATGGDHHVVQQRDHGGERHLPRAEVDRHHHEGQRQEDHQGAQRLLPAPAE